MVEENDLKANETVSANSDASEQDREIMEFLKESAPRILVIGTGGSGNNTLNRMQEVEIVGANYVAMNTDAQHLLKTKAARKILIGKQSTRGRGAGSNPEVGEKAAEESIEEFRELFKDSDLVFITCGLGGGTGTGSAHVLARTAREAGALAVAVVTLPFSSEGTKRMRNALDGLDKLKRAADTTIAIPNDKLLYFVPDLPLNAAFKTSDMVLTNAVKGITELITKPGLVNLDFADVKTILEKSGTAMIGLGEMKGEESKNRVVTAAEKALASPLLDLDIKEANKALVNITGGPGMTLGEAEAAVQAISSRINKEAHVIWGATVDETISDNTVQVLAVLAGIKEGAPAQESGDLDVQFI
ncbi:MAG: cell division protein FtsZ [Candidatus Micrarchaeota archaeon]